MADAIQVIGQKGPLPITTTFQVENDGPTLILLACSAWTQTGNVMIEVDLLVDGEAVAWAGLFCNPTGQHMALVSVPMPYTFSIGEHTFTLQAGNAETVSDINDFYYVTLLY
jgi:hypothetical protein